MQSHIPPLGALGEEFEQVDLAPIDEDVGVDVGRDRQLPLTDEGADLGPRSPLLIKESNRPTATRHRRLRDADAVPHSQSRGQHHLAEPGVPRIPHPRIHAGSAWMLGSTWARLDSNQGPTDYESAALTS